MAPEKEVWTRDDGLGMKSFGNSYIGMLTSSFLQYNFNCCTSYERELNRGCRPAFRCITTQDKSPSYPMVLCISRIVWPNGSVTVNETTKRLHPELELTDGWYRLRAQIDAPLARAVRRGILRVGRKIGVSGTRVCLIYFSTFSTGTVTQFLAVF